MKWVRIIHKDDCATGVKDGSILAYIQEVCEEMDVESWARQ